MSNTDTSNATPKPFELSLSKPFSTFDQEGKPKRVPYLVDGLLPDGAFSIIAGKPKHGKSSLARYEAVCVSKGKPFLGRDTVQGEVLLISLEDPLSHVDNALLALGYNPKTDAPIHIVEKLAPSIDESIAAIEAVLRSRPQIRLVIVDTLAKLLRVSDVNDYAKVMPQIEKIHDLARRFPHLHIQGLAHAKKAQTTDVFDSLLGSTALRGEPDTTIALYKERDQHIIATETRIGRSIPPTLLNANLVEVAGAHVVGGYELGVAFSEWEEDAESRTTAKHKASHDARIIEYLQGLPGRSAKQMEVFDAVEGKATLKLAAIERLKQAGVLRTTGNKQSHKNPLVLHLEDAALSIYLAFQGFGEIGENNDALNQ